MTRSLLPVFLFGLFVTAPVAAQENLTLFPRFTLSGAGYLSDYGTVLRVDPHVEGLEGTTVDFEKVLGLDTTQTISRVALQWRPLRKHELSLAYFQARRTGTRVIDRQIRFEDTVFPIRADIQTNLDIDFWDLSYTYWMRQRPRHGVGINIGITGMQIDARLALQGNGAVLVSEAAAADVPVPVFGLEGRFQLTDRLIGEARGSLLPSISISNYKGEAYLGKLSIEYRAVPKVGVGVAWNYFNLDGTIDQDDFDAAIGMTVSGVEGFVHIVFGGR